MSQSNSVWCMVYIVPVPEIPHFYSTRLNGHLLGELIIFGEYSNKFFKRWLYFFFVRFFDFDFFDFFNIWASELKLKQTQLIHSLITSPFCPLAFAHLLLLLLPFLLLCSAGVMLSACPLSLSLLFLTLSNWTVLSCLFSSPCLPFPSLPSRSCIYNTCPCSLTTVQHSTASIAI